jgi:hypothetical protein
MPPIHTKILHPFDMTFHIHHAKRLGYAKRKKYIRAQKHGKKEKENKKKDSSYPKIKKR